MRTRQASARSRNVSRRRISTLTGLLALLFLLSGPAAAQQIETTQALKFACETNPGNVVTLNQGTKIINGVRPPATEQVATGCTLMLGPSASFEADQVSMTFNGPFNIISSSQGGKAVFVKSQWQATSMNFDLTAGPKGEFKMAMSEMYTTQGDLVVRVGVEGQFQVQQRLVTTYTPRGAIDSAGSVIVSGGNKFLAQVYTSIHSVSGVSIALEGRESVLKSEGAIFRTERGPISLTGAAPKTLMEFKELSMEPNGGDARIVLAGEEATLKMFRALIDVDGGNAELRAGGLGSLGLIELVDSQVFASGSVAVLSSRESVKGVVKLSKSGFVADSDLLIATGSFGTTEVKENNLSAGNTLRVLTGDNGKCIVELNIVSAPFQQICQ